MYNLSALLDYAHMLNLIEITDNNIDNKNQYTGNLIIRTFHFSRLTPNGC